MCEIMYNVLLNVNMNFMSLTTDTYEVEVPNCRRMGLARKVE